jgi:hypothetical protein
MWSGDMNEVILKQVFEFIKGEIEQGNPPSIREISRGCNLGYERALDAVSILEARGKIEREEGLHRSIKIVAG